MNSGTSVLAVVAAEIESAIVSPRLLLPVHPATSLPMPFPTLSITDL
jgi:hypothetical protein